MNTEYKELIERVRLIDPAAAEYLEGDARKLGDFQPHENLISVMFWGDTPQGHEYWSGINQKLSGQNLEWKHREQGRMDNGIYDPVSLRGDDPDRFLHMSLVDPCMVAYTKDEMNGAADIQTRTTLERYIRKFGLETTGHVPSDSLREEKLEVALVEALIIIVGEYPKEDDRYLFAIKAAKEFGLDIGEMG